MEKVKPILKWAGGKSFLLETIELKLSSINTSESTLYEPFCGGLSVSIAFANKFKNVVANDANHKLINLYNMIKNQSLEVINNLNVLEKKNSEKEYYEIRDEERSIDFNKKSNPYKAARFIYLNKLSYNGLYRENNLGFYNVPYGKRRLEKIYDEKNLIELSSLFKKFEFSNEDFAICIKTAKKGDVVYFDPPYFPLNSISFTKYTKNDFTLEDQKRLFETMNELSKKGVYVIVSNSVTEDSTELYSEWIKGKESIIEARRLISSKVESRKKIQEYLIDNFEELKWKLN